MEKIISIKQNISWLWGQLMREKLTISSLPWPKRDDVIILKKDGNPDTIKLYWDNDNNSQHFGMVHYARVFGYDIEGYHSALIAERRGKILCLYCTGTK